jgi:hypothetical protein
MGLDVKMVPVRLDSAPMRAIRESAELWAQAELEPPFGSGGGTREPVPAISGEITALIPEGFGSYDAFPGRTWMQAEYLLDPVDFRRPGRYDGDERPLPYRIVHGDQRFAEHAIAGQGAPWRCSHSDFLAVAAARIDAIDVAAVRAEYSVAEMYEMGVYKVHEGEDDDENFAEVLADLRGLARWYRRLVGEGLDAIVIVW